jgi:two-component system, NtrC family, sensor histidine kinase GlrK
MKPTKRLSIFSRLIIVYCVIILLVTAVSIFAILKLHEFNAGTRHIISVDSRILDYEEDLSRIVLSQIRYEKKYVITRDPSFYDQVLATRAEFNSELSQLLSIVDTPAKKEMAQRLKASYERYQNLIDGEVERLKARRPYGQKWYEREKEKATDDVLEALETLETYSRKDIYLRMKLLREGANSARRFALIMSVAALGFVVGTSFLITRSITTPLKLLMGQTREISNGIFKCDLRISSPPEMAELARAFNSMCEKLTVVDKMKSDFFSAMSHELRTPLTSIREGTSLLMEGVAGETTEKQKKLLTIISVESRRLISLVDSLLDLSKMEAGMMTYRMEPMSLAPLIDQAISEIGPLAEGKRIRLEARHDTELPLPHADSERVLQVLRNLIGNAVKFTPGGGSVTVSAKPVEGGVQVSITDTGPGIPRENLSSIFNKFQQVTSTGPYGPKGTGLGLALAKHIITSHGGKIWAESEPGKGSVFFFVLPA